MVSHTVSSNEAKFLRFTESRGESFVSLDWSALTGLSFPGEARDCGEGRVPSLLYYDRSGKVRAAGAEALAGTIIETALTEGWQKAEWLVINLVRASCDPTHS